MRIDIGNDFVDPLVFNSNTAMLIRINKTQKQEGESLEEFELRIDKYNKPVSE
jgi:hypothetical protein